MELGAQTYNTRLYMQNEKDMIRSLKKIAGIGYKTVQISGIGEIAPRRLREICDELDLRIVLTHNPENRILYDIEAVIEENDILGCDYIGLGSMSDRYRGGVPEWISYFIEDFKEPAQKIAAADKLFMYHNHHFEFEKFGEKLLFDRLVEGFSKKEMGFTLDTYWVQAAGADICDWIEKLEGRIPCIHLKDMTVRNGEQIMAPVLEGNIPFAKIIKLLEKQGQTKYLIVEQDFCEESPFVCLKKSYDNLAGLGYQ